MRETSPCGSVVLPSTSLTWALLPHCMFFTNKHYYCITICRAHYILGASMYEGRLRHQKGMVVGWMIGLWLVWPVAWASGLTYEHSEIWTFNFCSSCVHDCNWLSMLLKKTYLKYWFTFSAACLKSPSNWSLAKMQRHDRDLMLDLLYHVFQLNSSLMHPFPFGLVSITLKSLFES